MEPEGSSLCSQKPSIGPFTQNMVPKQTAAHIFNSPEEHNLNTPQIKSALHFIINNILMLQAFPGT
jgi:hypothetical protein